MANLTKKEQKNRFINRWLPVIVIVGITFLVYSNAFRGEFFCDAELNIEQNPYIKDWRNFFSIFTKNYFSLFHEWTYRPVVTVTYFINYSLCKFNFTGWKLVNVLFHSFNGVLVYLLVRHLLKNKTAGLISGLIFVTHPVLTESINEISYREDIFAFFFFYVSFILVLKKVLPPGGENTPGSLKKNRYYLPFALVCYTLALFTKEESIIYPGVLGLYYLLFIPKQERKYRFFFPIIGISIIYLLISFVLLKPTGYALSRTLDQWPTYPGGSIYTALLLTGVVITKYLNLLLFPVKLSVDYPFTVNLTLKDTQVLSSFILVVSLILISVLVLKHSRVVSFSLIYFFIALLPVSNIVPFGLVMSERYLYFPIVGFTILISVIYRKLQEKSLPVRKITLCGILLLLSFYSVRTFARNFDWRDNISLAQSLIRDYPDNATGYYELGKEYEKQGNYYEAVKYANLTLNLDSQYAKAYHLIGNCNLKQRQYEKAAFNFKKAVEIDSTKPYLYNDLGAAYIYQGNYKTAIEILKKAVALYPLYTQAYNNLGVAYFKQGNLNEAVLSFRKAVAINPQDNETTDNLMTVLQNKVQIDRKNN